MFLDKLLKFLPRKKNKNEDKKKKRNEELLSQYNKGLILQVNNEVDNKKHLKSIIKKDSGISK